MYLFFLCVKYGAISGRCLQYVIVVVLESHSGISLGDEVWQEPLCLSSVSSCAKGKIWFAWKNTVLFMLMPNTSSIRILCVSVSPCVSICQTCCSLPFVLEEHYEVRQAESSITSAYWSSEGAVLSGLRCLVASPHLGAHVRTAISDSFTSLTIRYGALKTPPPGATKLPSIWLSYCYFGNQSIKMSHMTWSLMYKLSQNANVIYFHAFFYRIFQLILLIKNKLLALFFKFKKKKVSSAFLLCSNTDGNRFQGCCLSNVHFTSFVSSHLLMFLSLLTFSSLCGARKSTQGREGRRAKGSLLHSFQEICRAEA